MQVICYDHHFNTNEWFILISLFIGILMILFLPKRFSKKETCVFFMCGVFTGFVFDHTLSVLPVIYYVINDRSSFELMDFFSHVMYGPFSYFFFYLYDLINIKPRFSLVYILVWAFVSVGIEKICERIGVFHYEHGYTIYYSFVIYLMVVSLWVFFYRVINKYGDNQY